MQLKIVSWNIWVSKHIPEVIEQIKELNPDIIGLQEVTVINGKNSGQIIADALDYNHIHCQAFTTVDRDPPYSIGNSILSKYSLQDSSCRFLSLPEDHKDTSETEPRTAQFTILSVGDKQLAVANTHLGYSPNLTVTPSQRKQLDTLIPLLRNHNFLLMGDFNSLPQSEVVTGIEQHLKNTDDKKTQPTRVTEKLGQIQKDRIDYIFVSPDMKYSNFMIHETKASDHAPISVEIEL